MPVIKCKNNKWRVGNGACIYNTREKAVEVWQAILASGEYKQQFAKISYDYDDVLTKPEITAKAIKDVESGNTVYIISARRDKQDLVNKAKEIGVPLSRVYATGSNKAKVEQIKKINISKHYDNNKDVIDALGSNGIKI